MLKLETYFLCTFIALRLQRCLAASHESQDAGFSESMKPWSFDLQTSKELPNNSIDVLKWTETQVKLDRIERLQAVLHGALKKVQGQLTGLEEQWRLDMPFRLQKNYMTLKFEKIGDRFFYIEKDSRVSWFSAANTCRQMGGQLATIQSEEERVAIVKKLPGLYFWLGINNLANEDEYVSLTTGQVAPFFQWGVSQPNKKNENVVENCIAIVQELMHDYKCVEKMRFICQAQA